MTAPPQPMRSTSRHQDFPTRQRPSAPASSGVREAAQAERLDWHRNLAARFKKVRKTSEDLCAPLSPEDCVVQSMPDASPVKWHLAHTTWFFETFVLEKTQTGFRPYHADFPFLYNSYYKQVGAHHPRLCRGMITRPALDEVRSYRRHVDDRILELVTGGQLNDEHVRIVELGLHHEQQHQELILMDIKHLFSCNPLWPSYSRVRVAAVEAAVELRWIGHEEGIHSIGFDGGGFSFDHECPRHRVFLESFEIGSRLVTNGEYQAFIEDGGYDRPELWLSDGWDAVQQQGWSNPLYWRQQDGGWYEFTLGGPRKIRPADPVCHVSYYEADAYARWTGCRLPTEAEWEFAAHDASLEGNFLETGLLHPAPASGVSASGGLLQGFGDVWEWTSSPFTPYPSYRPPAGALGEYNGKFMSNQMVLRGGCCATSASHIRATYRNFFYPVCRWQFGGIRLARDGR